MRCERSSLSIMLSLLHPSSALTARLACSNTIQVGLTSAACSCCSGQLAQGTYALNSNKGKRERISRLQLMHANSREDIAVARTGDIVAVAGLKDIITGETLCDEKDPIILERMEVRSPHALHGAALMWHACQNFNCFAAAVSE